MRPPRIDEPGMYHHITNRGRNRQVVFKNVADCELFLEHLAIASATCRIEVHAFALMDNHYHLLIRSLEGRLSEAMQGLGSRYTQDFHDRHGTDGSLFKGRFFSKTIDSDGYLLEGFRYVVNNPVKAGIVKRAQDHQWSSYPATLGLVPAPRFLNRLGIVDEYFNGDVAVADAFVRRAETARDRLYRHAVEQRTAEPSLQASLDEATRTLEQFMTEVTGHPHRPQLLLSQLADFTCSAFGVTIYQLIGQQVFQDREARTFFLLQLHRHEVASTSELAAGFGLSESSVRRLLKAGRERLREDANWRLLMQSSLQLLPRSA